MSNWKRSSFQDVLTEASPGYSKKHFLRFFIFGIPEFIFSLFYRFSVIPILLFLLIRAFSIQNSLLLILVWFIYIQFNTISQQINSMKVILELKEYIIELLNKKFSFKKFLLEDYLDNTTIKKLLPTRQFSMINDSSLGSVLILIPPKGTNDVPMQKKGFTIPIGHSKSERYKIKSISAIFLRDTPEDTAYSAMGTFQLFHEIGHMTKYSFDLKVRGTIGRLNLIFVSLLLVFLFKGFSIHFLWFVPYLLYLIIVESDRKQNEIEDELVTDTFALKLYPEDKLKRLKRVLSKFSGLEEFRKKNLFSLIDKRIKGQNFSPDYLIYKNQRFRYFTSFLMLLGCLFLPLETSWIQVLILLGISIFAIISAGSVKSTLILHTDEIEHIIDNLDN